MKKSILALTLFIVGFLCAASTFANGNHDKNSHHEHEAVVHNHEIIINIPTIETIETRTIETQTIDYGRINALDLELSGSIAASAAIASIPGISHQNNEHGHSGVGFGMATYNGVESAALGARHQKDQFSFNLNASCPIRDCSKPIVGGGALVSF